MLKSIQCKTYFCEAWLIVAMGLVGDGYIEARPLPSQNSWNSESLSAPQGMQTVQIFAEVMLCQESTCWQRWKKWKHVIAGNDLSKENSEDFCLDLNSWKSMHNLALKRKDNFCRMLFIFIKFSPTGDNDSITTMLFAFNS